MTDPAGPDQTMPRAFLRVGGSTLARHQMGLALTLECQRILCIAKEITPELIALQHEAERAGAQFHVVAGAPSLIGLVHAGDELLVLAEGLIARAEEAIPLIESGQAVLVQPVESGLPAGFERIDLNHASAGMMRIPGRLVERLAVLPPDCDVPSALLRLALQAGVPIRPVPASARDGARWTLVRSEAEAHSAENAWILMQIGEKPVSAPSSLIARRTVLAFGPALLHAGSGSRVVVLSSAAVMLMALGAGWLGFVALGYLLCVFAWLGQRTAVLLERVEHDPLLPPSRHLLRRRLLEWLFDAELVLLAVWGGQAQPWQSLLDLAFPPLILICLLRLVAHVLAESWTSWTKDRGVLALFLAAAALGGVLGPAIMLSALCLAAAGMLLPARRSRITRA